MKENQVTVQEHYMGQGFSDTLHVLLGGGGGLNLRKKWWEPLAKGAWVASELQGARRGPCHPPPSLRTRRHCSTRCITMRVYFDTLCPHNQNTNAWLLPMRSSVYNSDQSILWSIGVLHLVFAYALRNSQHRLACRLQKQPQKYFWLCGRNTEKAEEHDKMRPFDADPVTLAWIHSETSLLFFFNFLLPPHSFCNGGTRGW